MKTNNAIQDTLPTALRYRRTAMVLAALVTTCCSLLTPATAQTITSAVPGFISYQGKVLNSSGGLVGAGTPVNRTVIFRIWDHASNTLVTNLLYSEQQTVTISEGEFSVLVGQGVITAGTPLGYSESAKGPGTVSLGSLGVFAGPTRFLGVTVDDGTAAVDNEITPRQQIVSSAYALRAKYAESLGSNGATSLTALDSGNVGIGNANPLVKLQVSGGSEANLGSSTGFLSIGDTTSTNVIFDDNEIQARNNGAAANLILNEAGGNVGIGNASPTARLDVTGGIKATGAGGYTFNTGDLDGGLFSPADGIITLNTNGAEKVRVDGSGKVGIGTTAPSSLLSLGSTLANSKLLLYDDGTSFHGLGVQANQFRLHTATSADRFSFLNAPNGTENLTILGGGNVGIGITAPAAKLDVAGKAAAYAVQGRGSVTTHDQGAYLEWNRLGTGETNFVNQKGLGSGGWVWYEVDAGTTYTERMRMDGNGAVGIGATPNTARAKLTVGSVFTSAGVNTPFPQGRYMDNTSTGAANTTWGGGTVSIEAQSNIVCNGVWATSDERIKKVGGHSDGAADLKTLLGIKVTDYVFKDQIANGSQPQKKVIAQQVEKIFPQAVSQGTNTVPDIFKKAAIEDGWLMLTTDLKKGDRVKLINDKNVEAIQEVLEVKKDKFRTDFKTEAKNVFVYGREVNDFRRVDYEAIAMLNVSATQQIKKEKDAEVQALKEENTSLKDQLAAQAKQLAELQAKDKARDAADKARDAKLAAIEKALESTAAKSAVRTASLKKAE